MDRYAGVAPPVQRQARTDPAAASRSVEPQPAGSGDSLPDEVRRGFEDVFDFDFSAVRVHEDGASEAIGARAFTRGADIHFAPGEYDPATEAGRALLGHELTHVVQQAEGRVAGTSQASGLELNDDAGLEREADELGARAARGERVARGAGDAARGPSRASQVAQAARTQAQIDALSTDCLGAISGVETEGKVKESNMHTVSGVRASYASANQHIASKTVSVLKRFDEDQLAELDLTPAEVLEANRVVYSARKVYELVVKQRVAITPAGIRDAVDAKTMALSRFTDDDLALMVKGAELFADLHQRIDAAGGKDAVKDDAQAVEAIAQAIAATPLAKQLDIRVTDFKVYITKGINEDMAGWQRVALDRPPPGKANDGLGAKIQSAAEGENGWRMGRVDIEGAVESYLEGHPEAQDLEVLWHAVDHHAQGASAKYHAKAVKRFEELRAARASGQPWSHPKGDEPAGKGGGKPADPGADPIAAAMAPGLALLLALARLGREPRIEASVGQGGANQIDDVREVGLRLQRLGVLAPTGVDGAALIAAIRTFQATTVGMKNPDGRVDPDGKTLPAIGAAISGSEPADESTKPQPKPDDHDPTPQPQPVGPGPVEPDPDEPHRPRPEPRVSLPIGASVGKGGANLGEDVSMVRARLTELEYDCGSSNAELGNAVQKFQSRAFNKAMSSCDGRIDPGGKTNHALAAGAAPAPTSISNPAAVVESSSHPEVAGLRLMIDDLAAFESTVTENLNEEIGEKRKELVERIGVARGWVDGLVLEGMPSDEAIAVRAWGHRRLNALSPYSSQGRNVNFLETEGESSRTCNLTALAMALEALGKSTGDYAGNLDVLRSIRSYEGKGKDYRYADAFDKAWDTTGEDVLGLRMPDFLQLVTVAYRMAQGKTLLAAVKQGWDDILFTSRLRDLACEFGVAAWTRDGLGGKGSLAQRYRDTYGAELDRGHQVVLLTPGHFVRLQEITDGGLIVDDPGKHEKKNLFKPWSEVSGYTLSAVILA